MAFPHQIDHNADQLDWRHLPLRAKRDALLPIPLTHHIRAQRSLLHKWQKLHPHQTHANKRQNSNTSSTTGNQSTRYSTSSRVEQFSHAQSTRYISKEELDFKRAKILAKPSWLLPFYHPSIKLNTGAEFSSITSGEEMSNLFSEEMSGNESIFSASYDAADAIKSVQSEPCLLNKKPHKLPHFNRSRSIT